MSKQIAIIFSKSLFDPSNIDFDRKSDLALSNSLLEDVKVTLYFSLEALDNLVNYQSDSGLLFGEGLPSWLNFIQDRLEVVPSDYYAQELRSDLPIQNVVLQAVAMEELVDVVLFHPEVLSETQKELLSNVREKLATESSVFLFEEIQIIATDKVELLLTPTTIKF